jgi:dTMP kinase
MPKVFHVKRCRDLAGTAASASGGGYNHQAPMPGRLITLEGIDGVGKTTHLSLLQDLLRGHGLNVRAFRDPGSTALGEQQRLLIKGGVMESPLAELLLFAAARAELVTTRVRPALAAGGVVLLDRFTDSTLAYQGALMRIPEPALKAVCGAAADGLKPDLTLWLDLDPCLALQRRYPLAQALFGDAPCPPSAGAQVGGGDAIEQRDTGYYTRVRERYLALSEGEPERIVRIDACGPKDETARLVRDAVAVKLKEWRIG